MAHQYTISHANIVDSISDASKIKNVTLKVNGKEISHISKCTERTTDLRTLDSTGDKKVLNECYIDLTLDKLRELDSDTYAQDNYISSRSKFLERGLVNVVMIKLRLENNQKIEREDRDYLNALLSWPRNDIYVMPVLDFANSFDRKDRIDVYNEFVKDMLTDKSSWLDNTNIGMSIPAKYYPRRDIEKLFDIYSDEKPSFIAIDFSNGRMDKPNNILGTVMKHFIDENEENTFLYGVNVKPFKKGQDNTAAWDMYMVHGSFNAIGPAHSKAHPVVLPGDWMNMGRIFDDKDISYVNVDTDHRDGFIDWMAESYDLQINPEFKKNERSLYSYLKRYNFEKTNEKLFDLSEAVKKGDSDLISDFIKHMPEEMSNVKMGQISEGRGKRTRSSE